jgi:hypothetical protein
MPAGQAWVTGIDGGGRWYWEAAKGAPEPYAGHVLFDDTQHVFVLPYGKEGSQGGIRFTREDLCRGYTVGSGNTALNYVMGFYLLHMNLLPREMMAQPGRLSVNGEELLEQRRVIHLRLEGAVPELAVKPAARRAVAGQDWDLFYDPERQAIVRAVLNAGDSRLVLRVSAWSNFGTKAQWPSIVRAESQSIGGAAQEGAAGPANPVLVTSVDRFDSGADARVAEIQRQVNGVDLFLTPVRVVRPAVYYENSLSKGENLHDRAALAFASFSAGNVVEGLKQWNVVEAQVAEPSRVRLWRNLIGPACAALVRQSAAVDQQAACMELFEKLLRTPKDEEFGEASDAMERAWETLRKAPATRETMHAQTEGFLKRVAEGRLVSVFVLERLIRLANAGSDDRALINPVFQEIFNQSVPMEGLFKSRQDMLLIGALRAGDLSRAEAYVDAMKWPEGIKPELREVGETWRTAFIAAKEARSGREGELEQLIGLHHQFSGYRDDEADRVYGTELVVTAGVNLLSARSSSLNNLDDFLERTARRGSPASRSAA